jgi:putative hydrolase of the HAD superfamily
MLTCRGLRSNPAQRVWLFDLDNTLHNASFAAFGGINEGMNAYIQRELGLDETQAAQLRRQYWLRYGATLLGLVKHHGVQAAHFLHHTHLLPGLEATVHGHRHDLAALRRLPGLRIILTNAPRAYALRVLDTLGITGWFDAVLSIEDMQMFGHFRPKPDARMFRQLLARLRVPASRCVLVEDTLEHQRAAHRLGIRTVWMQRWAQDAGHEGRFARRPAYVDVRLRQLCKLRIQSISRAA